jgi:hypothetical protein
MQTATATAAKSDVGAVLVLRLLGAIADAGGEQYAGDPTRAGIVFSHLADGSFYVSLVRYIKADTKCVISKGYSKSFPAALVGCAEGFIASLRTHAPGALKAPHMAHLEAAVAAVKPRA